MAFSYYRIYRTEGPTPYNNLIGAARQPNGGPNSWVFFMDGPDDESSPKLRVFHFASVKDGPSGQVHAVLEDSGAELTFIPVDPKFVSENPDRYADLVVPFSNPLSTGDLFLLGHAQAISDEYEAGFGPKEEAPPTQEALEEGRTPSPVGTIHRWKDGHDYQKQADGSWRRLSAAGSVSESETWKDSDPSLPFSSMDLHYDYSTKQFTPERQILHREILDRIFEGVPKVPLDQTPTAVVTMGISGSGKSSIVRDYLASDELANLDADDIKKQLPEFQAATKLRVRNAGSIVQDEASLLHDMALDRAVRDRHAFVFDGVGSHAEWYGKMLNQMDQAEYDTTLLMSHVENEDELGIRCEVRGLRSGQFIPPGLISKRMDVIPKNFTQFLGLVRSAVLFNNNNHEPVPAYRKDDDTETILDTGFWRRFQGLVEAFNAVLAGSLK